MHRRRFLAGLVTGVSSLAFGRVGRNRPLNQGLRLAVATAKLIDKLALDRVAAVTLEESHICFAVAGAVTATLRDRGRTAWLVEGGPGLEADLAPLEPRTVYMAHFGGLPDPVVQRGVSGDLEQIMAASDPEALVLHWPTLARGYFEQAVYEIENALEWIENRRVYAVINQDGTAVLKRLTDPLAWTWATLDQVPLSPWPPLIQ